MQGSAYGFLQEFSLLGSDAGMRMVVIRLADGTLWVHSPIQLTTELAVMIGGAPALLRPLAFHLSPSMCLPLTAFVSSID